VEILEIMNAKALIAEFIGTFALIFIGVGAIAARTLAGGSAELDWIALAHGLTIAVMVSATAAISGGHLNPAVTFGAWLAKKIDLKHALGYIIFQCLGAIFAASLLKLAVPINTLQAIGMGTPTLGEGVSPLMGVFMEFILTFFLVFVIFGTAIDLRAPKMGGLFIGLTVTMDILAGGPITGGAMNPARYLGSALMGGGLQYFWLYWIGPLASGAAAALLYHYMLEEKYKVSLKDVSAVELQGLIQQLNNLNHKLRREEI
jgi:aquaporin Z